ncbi:hypothetical protein J2X69_004170 [Algoriphagus sp. 4150]|uniref:hypothetical protein n=1 Tax=Algoriphagus sp. 4150 TaxID=2817756 RepID=UPI00285A4759|nr:hypothetical protein [Algoriphagus sp. 4150]MDR7131805.1 hypothetical protein [Algoriphagus sp. 4150]
MNAIKRQLWLLVPFFICFWHTTAIQGQVQVNVQIIPPYQSRAVDYASRPELLSVTLINTGNDPLQIQLTGWITGENGVSARLRAGYKSPQPILLPPRQPVQLNGNDIRFLFDINQIIFEGVSKDDFLNRAGLPEGIYEICVQALDYTTLEPLSDERMGCSQLLLRSLEPPTILQPFSEQELPATAGVQSFPILWSTPPGAAPNTQYLVKMVEMIAPRNPNDAMQSATTPAFFEETIYGNTLLYGPQYPQLTVGRQYALMVQAIDPFGTSSFRNRGMSEVIQFTYGQNGSQTGGTGTSPVIAESQTPLEYATHTVSGKLSWAFKSSEENFKKGPVIHNATQTSAASPGSSAVGAQTNSIVAGMKSTTMISQASLNATPVNYYLGHNKLQASKPTALGQADPTLSMASSLTVASGILASNVSATALAATDIISSSASNSLAYNYETISLDTGSQRHPLADVTVTIRGIKSQGAPPKITNQPSNPNKTPNTLQKEIQFGGLRTSESISKLGTKVSANTPVSQATSTGTSKIIQDQRANQTTGKETDPISTVLATARTDAGGNFTLQLLHPEYEGKNPYEKLVVSVNAPGFEPFEYELPIQRLEDLAIDLGSFTLLAKTYRFQPKLTIETSEPNLSSNPGMRIRVYRESSELDKYPYLRHEGMPDAANKPEILLAGRRYRLVAVDSIQAGGNPIKSVEFAMARLFYQGSLYIEIEGLSGNLIKKSTQLRVSDTKASSSRILVVKPGYESRLTRPSVNGEVILQAGENLVPIPGAVLTVEYNKEDVLAENTGGVTTLANGLNVQAEVANVAALMTNPNIGQVSFASTSPVNPISSAAALSSNGIAKPVAITSAVQTGASTASASFSYATITVSDELMSEQQLKSKYGLYTVKTDSTGQYLIGNLPILKEGASYTLKLVSLPYNYRDMEVTPGKEQSFTAVKGSSETRSFSVVPEVFNIVGRVIDLKETGVPYARLHFKGGSNYFESGEEGLFQTSFYKGKHTLVVEKEGYILMEIPVELGKESESSGAVKGKKSTKLLAKQQNVTTGTDVMNLSNPDSWVKSMQSTPTVQKAVQAGSTFSPALFGNAGSVKIGALGLSLNTMQSPGDTYRGPSDAGFTEDQTSYSLPISLSTLFSSQINTTFHLNHAAYASTKTHDLGDIGPLLPRIGKVRFTVVEKGSDLRIPEAKIALFDTIQSTDQQGQWLYEGFGGQATVTVTPPSGMGYVTLQAAINILETGEVTEVTLSLEKGVRVHGQVSSGGEKLADTRISVEGKEYLFTTSGPTGAYELVLPAGEQVIRAAKSGYLSKNENRILPPSGGVELNFMLEDGGGKNISTLLGFDIELDKAVVDGNGQKWNGRFVNMQAAPTLFGESSSHTIPFANVKVTFDAEGNALPANGEVITDISNLPLKLFGYLPVILKGDQQLRVMRNGEGKGSISGKVELAVNQIQGSRGFNFSPQDPLFIALENSTGPANLEVFREGGVTGAPEATVRFASGQGNTVSMNLYGFGLNLDLAKSAITTGELRLAGILNTPALGPVSSAELVVETFTISRELRIQSVRVKNTDLPAIKIGGWEAALANVIFSENGFKLGGQLKVSIPQSGESQIEFANLSLGKDAIYGGQFSFPDAGLNVYNIVKLTTAGNPLSFGRVGNTQVYSLSGSASMKFDQLITKEIKIPSFQVQTDGRFLLQSPVNYSADLSFAKFNIKNLTVSSLSGQAPFISVQGEFNVNFKGLKFEVADIRFKAKSSGGSEYDVGVIGGELALPIMKVGVRVGIKNNGFEGGGSLGVPGTPINAEVNFHYYKLANGIDIGADFKSGIIIPVGIVEINRVGGGFQYNTGNGKFKINISGGASITGLSTLVNLEPISLTVTDGPVIVGEVGVKVASAFELAKARVELNVPGKFFSIGINADIEPIKGVASAKINGLLRIKWDPNESYVFLGANTQVNVLGFFNSYGEYAMGVNIWDPKYREDDISAYFRYLDSDLYARGDDYKFSGVYLHGKTEIGVRKENAKSIDLYIVSGKAWFHTYSDVMLLLNFSGNDYRMRVAGGLSAGAEGCIGPGCIGAGFSACYAFTGGYGNAQGWFLNGKAAGSFEGHVGKKCNCNRLCFIGGRVCVGAHASIAVSTRGGNSFGVGLGSSNSGNSCF